MGRYVILPLKNLNLSSRGRIVIFSMSFSSFCSCCCCWHGLPMQVVTIIGGSSIAAAPGGYAGQEPSHYLRSTHGSTNNVWHCCGLLPTVTGCARCITRRANNIGAAIGGCCNDLKPFKKNQW
jgi:hypothetical protein